jgi:hypothetical protein
MCRRRGLADGEIDGLWRQQIGIDSSIFCQRTLQPADAAGHSVNFVPVSKGRHAVADGLDDARKIDAENGRQGLARMGGLAGANLDVERIDGTGFDPDQNLPPPGLRPGS